VNAKKIEKLREAMFLDAELGSFAAAELLFEEQIRNLPRLTRGSGAGPTFFHIETLIHPDRLVMVQKNPSDTTVATVVPKP
jgi:hypothetical protein